MSGPRTQGGSDGRARQRLRTRKDLLRAAARLARDGRTPTIEEVAEAAMVSRATAYRYFPSVEAVVAEAGLDNSIPGAEEVFAGDDSTDAFARIWKVDQAINDPTYDNPVAARITLASLLQRKLSVAEADSDVPARQNRRSPLIAAALAPVRDQFARGEYELLCAALALFFGIEGMVVFKDVLGLEDQKAKKVRRWALRALLDAALGPQRGPSRARS